MRLKVFCCYDSKAEAYMQPFFMNSRGEAIRSWIDVVNDGKSAISRYPTDFTLFEIGEFDDSTGQVQMHSSYVSLGVAIEHKKEPVQQVPMFNDMKAVK